MGLFGPKHALPAPPAIGGDRQAAELIRAWVAHDDLHVVLRHDAFEDEAPWAVALVDIARHIANAFQQTRGRDPDDVLRRLRDVLNAEWDTKRDDAEGSITK